MRRAPTLTPGSRPHRVVGWLAKLGLLVAATVAAALAAEPTPGTEAALSAAQWKSIQRVVSQQRTALVAGDGKKAFGYASPGIQAQFGDAATFMTMVRTGYAPLLTARYTEFLEGAVIDGVVVQPLRLIDADNTVRVALYTMERQKNGTWRISGCRIAPSTVQAI
ncbi:MAG TPA: DUF4864 domain-containing protein [Casimicrobiaceae bacterium]|nr:DUF4864 domain-containing protein [Casimicrobiaceae bacterium]